MINATWPLPGDSWEGRIIRLRVLCSPWVNNPTWNANRKTKSARVENQVPAPNKIPSDHQFHPKWRSICTDSNTNTFYFHSVGFFFSWCLSLNTAVCSLRPATKVPTQDSSILETHSRRFTSPPKDPIFSHSSTMAVQPSRGNCRIPLWHQSIKPLASIFLAHIILPRAPPSWVISVNLKSMLAWRTRISWYRGGRHLRAALDAVKTRHG